MIAVAMLYATAVAALLGAAAWCAERAVGLAGRGARVTWGLVMTASLFVPAVGGVRRLTTPSLTPAAVAPGRAADGAPSAAWRELIERASARVDATLEVPAAWRRFDVPLALAWAAATALLLARRAAAAGHLARRARAWPARVVGGVPVRVADEVGPALAGVLRPQVVLPAWALDPGQLDHDQLALVLRHEEEHRRARDPLLLAAGEVAAALAPWNAALWWQLRRLRAAVEVDCDRRVLRSHTRAMARSHAVRTYAQLLLDVAARPPAADGTPGLALSRTSTLLSLRISTMTAPRPTHALLRALVLVGGTLAAAAAAAALPRPALARPTTRPTAAVQDTTRRSGTPAGAKAPSMDSALVVVDGREVGRGSDVISRYKPDSIASVNVLKGPAATQKYGARGQRGVVELTTKRGGAGR